MTCLSDALCTDTRASFLQVSHLRSVSVVGTFTDNRNEYTPCKERPTEVAQSLLRLSLVLLAVVIFQPNEIHSPARFFRFYVNSARASNSANISLFVAFTVPLSAANRLLVLYNYCPKLTQPFVSHPSWSSYPIYT